MDAEKKYIELIKNLLEAEGFNSNNVEQQNESDLFSLKGEIETSIEYGNVLKIVLNRPNKLNAITINV